MPASTNNIKLLSLKEVKTVLADNGIEIIENKELNPEKYILKGIKPRIFNLEEEKNTAIFIYIFESIEDRIKAAQGISNLKTEKTNSEQEFKEVLFTDPHGYKAKNVLIFHAARKGFLSSKEYEKAVLLKQVVFEKLNDTKEIVFRGRNENWEAIYHIKYYQYLWENDENILQTDSYHYNQFSLRYIGTEEVGSIKEIKYVIKRNNREISRGTLVNPDDKTATLINSEGSGAIEQADDIITIEIEWPSRKEILKLIKAEKSP